MIYNKNKILNKILFILTVVIFSLTTRSIYAFEYIQKHKEGVNININNQLYSKEHKQYISKKSHKHSKIISKELTQDEKGLWDQVLNSKKNDILYDKTLQQYKKFKYTFQKNKNGYISNKNNNISINFWLNKNTNSLTNSELNDLKTGSIVKQKEIIIKLLNLKSFLNVDNITNINYDDINYIKNIYEDMNKRAKTEWYTNKDQQIPNISKKATIVSQTRDKIRFNIHFEIPEKDKYFIGAQVVTQNQDVTFDYERYSDLTSNLHHQKQMLVTDEYAHNSKLLGYNLDQILSKEQFTRMKLSSISASDVGYCNGSIIRTRYDEVNKQYILGVLGAKHCFSKKEDKYVRSQIINILSDGEIVPNVDVEKIISSNNGDAQYVNYTLPKEYSSRLKKKEFLVKKLINIDTTDKLYNANDDKGFITGPEVNKLFMEFTHSKDNSNLEGRMEFTYPIKSRYNIEEYDKCKISSLWYAYSSRVLKGDSGAIWMSPWTNNTFQIGFTNALVGIPTQLENYASQMSGGSAFSSYWIRILNHL